MFVSDMDEAYDEAFSKLLATPEMLSLIELSEESEGKLSIFFCISKFVTDSGEDKAQNDLVFCQTSLLGTAGIIGIMIQNHPEISGVVELGAPAPEVALDPFWDKPFEFIT